MSISQKLKDYLSKSKFDYEEIAHKTVYTAYDAAQTLKKNLKEIAKNLLIQADKTFVLVIIPADKKLHLEKLKKALGAKKISIPKEQLMVKILKIKPGALSSFGGLHKLETVVDKTMLQTQKAVMSAGSFTDSILMKVKDFVQLEEAKLADIAMTGGYKIPKSVKKQMKKVKASVAKKGAKKAVKKPAQKVAKKALKKAVKKTVKKPVKKTVKKAIKKK
ncbi:MAG: YbaK/EbsC family protein [Candidatus Buchananbacteria bacterium]